MNVPEIHREIAHAWVDGAEVEQWCDRTQSWLSGSLLPSFSASKYRLKPISHSIDWSHVNERYIVLVAHKTGEVRLYTKAPTRGPGENWYLGPRVGESIDAENFTSFKRGTVSWDESLVFRPSKEMCAEPATNGGQRLTDAKPIVLPEPDSYLFQHEDTGQTMFVDAQQVEWGFEANNPRLHKVSGVYTEQQVRELLANSGQSVETTEGATDEVTALPDGSAFAVYSYPLPKDHWLYAPREYEHGAEEPKELAAPILTHAAREQVVSAIRYAVRAATDCGKETDFDPDALVQNAVYALCGPFNKNQPQPQADAGDEESEKLLRALYNRGYEDRAKERDYDPLGASEFDAAMCAGAARAKQADALDAERWRFIKRKLCLSGNGDGTCAMQALNLPARILGWPDVGELAIAKFLDAAIDAAIAAAKENK